MFVTSALHCLTVKALLDCTASTMSMSSGSWNWRRISAYSTGFLWWERTSQPNSLSTSMSR